MGIEVEGLKEIQAAFAAVQDSWSSGSTLSRQVLPKVGAVDAKQNEQSFTTQGAASGPKWKILSDNPPGKGYRSYKARVRPNRKILRFDGGLADSLRFVSRPQHIQRMASATVMEFGTSHPLAAVHQDGAFGTARVSAHRRRTRHGSVDIDAHNRRLALPPRPPVRKSERQKGGLRAAVLAAAFNAASVAAGTSTSLGAQFKEIGESFRKDARASHAKGGA